MASLFLIGFIAALAVILVIKHPLSAATANPLLNRNYVLYWPIFGTILMLFWSGIVAPFTTYGDTWAVAPALALFAAALVVQICLVIRAKGKIGYIAYAVIHAAVSFELLLLCLTLISKDSL
ncbi:MAG TPA: hypothetical protein VFH89_15995 [Sphingomicrobium sp.]|nr:hypothetical protein [Sphingomicrobium sp.]